MWRFKPEGKITTRYLDWELNQGIPDRTLVRYPLSHNATYRSAAYCSKNLLLGQYKLQNILRGYDSHLPWLPDRAAFICASCSLCRDGPWLCMWAAFLICITLRGMKVVLTITVTVTITVIKCICVIATEMFEKISVAITRTHRRDEKAQLSSGRILIASELSSLNLNSLVRAELSFTIPT